MWQAVEQCPWVIGDFVWTGFDYLGESGIGHSRLDNRARRFGPVVAVVQRVCGDMDICGFKKPQSYYRDVLWRRSPLEIAGARADSDRPHRENQRLGLAG